MGNDLLMTSGLTKKYGGLTAVDSVDFQVRDGEVIAVIGPNGAGKSTLFNLITGVVPPTSGEISFLGESLVGVAAHAVAHRGIARTFQNLKLFRNLSVLENVMAGFHAKSKPSLSEVIGPHHAQHEQAWKDKGMELLAFVELDTAQPEKTPARNLPYGQQRLLEIARALATGPRLLLLDEPAAGLNPEESAKLMDLIGRIRAQGITVMLVEHNVELVMEVSERVMVLDLGRKLYIGTPDEVRTNPEVIRAYLGTEVA
jgi:ABC-type branched-subunit amino acid transport system ATPase component